MKIAIFSRRQVSVLKFLVVAIIFSLAYTQEPIYNSPESSDGNQNTKFLHGLARAGFGSLDRDWMAGTIDPLPAFTTLVEFTYQYIHREYAFYVYYGLIMGLYVYSLVAIANTVYQFKKTRAKYLLYLALFICIHAVNLEIGNFDTAWHLTTGVAQQYILGPVLQPCTFGAFVLLSIWLVLYERYYWAVLSGAIAATFHPAYLFSVATLTLSYLLVLKQNVKKALLVGCLSFALILPIVSYMFLTFGATSPQLERQAIEILVDFRTPHHSIPEVWLTAGTAHVQALLTIIGLYLIRRTRLFQILLIPFLAAFYLTILQIVLDSKTIGFIAPWRLSAFLVPISTAIILAAIVSFTFEFFEQCPLANQGLVVASLAIISALTVQGLDKQINLFQYQGESTPMLNFVRETKETGDAYLVPPDLQQLQKFRLYTGVPIFINQKSHPYKDTEVIEWYNRLTLATQVYESDGDRCQRLQQLTSDYNLTHVVAQRQNDFQCELQVLYQDREYTVYKL